MTDAIQPTAPTDTTDAASPAAMTPPLFGKGRIVGALVLSFVCFHVPIVADFAAYWSNHWLGLWVGMFHILFLQCGWWFVMVPWTLLVLGIAKWRGWRRHLGTWIVAPALAVMLYSLADLALHPPTPARRLYRVTGATLPADAANLRAFAFGGGISDYSDSYYFETTPAEVDRLIAELKLTPHDPTKRINVTGEYVARRFPDWPDPMKWEGRTQYDRDFDGWHWSLVTDATRTRVYLSIASV